MLPAPGVCRFCAGIGSRVVQAFRPALRLPCREQGREIVDVRAGKGITGRPEGLHYNCDLIFSMIAVVE